MLFGDRPKREVTLHTGISETQLAGLANEVFELENLLDYQDGAIVSRTLVDREPATLTVFACDAGQSISEHTAHHEALLQCIDGHGRITIRETEYKLDAGESIVMPADVPHALEATDRFKMMLT